MKKYKTNYTLDLKTYKEFSKGYGNNIFSIILLTFMLIILILNIIVKNYNTAIYFSLFCIIYIILESILINSKIQYKRLLENNNGNPPYNTIIIDNEGISGYNEKGNKSNYTFNQIIGINETKNLIILKLKYGLGIILDKNTLDNDKLDLYNFLFDKCPNIKRKKVYKKNKISIIYLIIFILLFLLSNILNYKNNYYINNLINNLEFNGYSVYVIDDIDILVYEINKDDTIAYLYNFNDKEEALNNISYWFSLESNGTCNNDKTICEIYDDYKILKEYNGNVLYGIGEKEELDKLISILDLSN